MLFEEFWLWLESREISYRIGETWLFPFLESIHVLSACMVVGAILMLDLRLLGLTANRYAINRFAKELVPWSIGAFVVAFVTGLGMFIVRTVGYLENSAFQFKMLLLIAAGINMLAFHVGVFRSVDIWGNTMAIPKAAKISAVLSLIFWVGVMLAGRWIGHTL